MTTHDNKCGWLVLIFSEHSTSCDNTGMSMRVQLLQSKFICHIACYKT